jgi:hypothetical protein
MLCELRSGTPMQRVPPSFKDLYEQRDRRLSIVASVCRWYMDTAYPIGHF